MKQKFKVGEKVVYIPRHANNDPTHKDCEIGEVSSIRNGKVYVKYMRNGILQETAELTPVELLGHYF